MASKRKANGTRNLRDFVRALEILQCSDEQLFAMAAGDGLYDEKGDLTSKGEGTIADVRRFRQCTRVKSGKYSADPKYVLPDYVQEYVRRALKKRAKGGGHSSRRRSRTDRRLAPVMAR